MKSFYKILLIIIISVSNTLVQATELNEALKKSLNSAKIKSQQYSFDSNRKQILRNTVSNFVPNVQFNLETKEELQNNPHKTKASTITVSQQIFSAGRKLVSLSQSTQLLEAEKLKLDIFKQEYLMQAVSAYMRALAASEIYKLKNSTEQLSKKHYLAFKKRFDAGEITKTDLSTAKAKVALSTLETLNAKSEIKLAEIAYINIIGEPPKDLSIPTIIPPSPNSLEESIRLAKIHNPSLKLARQSYRTVQNTKVAAASNFLPSVDLSASFRLDDNTSPILKLNVSVPISQNILTLMDLDSALTLSNQRKYELYNSIKSVEESINSSWEEISSTDSMLIAIKETISAAEIALENVEQEFNLNLKTSLDVLDREQDLLKTRTDLINAKEKYIISKYKLLSLIGTLKTN